MGIGSRRIMRGLGEDLGRTWGGLGEDMGGHGEYMWRTWGEGRDV